jgi:class 3 adenylate cyclase
MMNRDYYFCWEWELDSSPEALWEYVASTDRFNRDTHLNPVTILNAGQRESTQERLRLQMDALRLFGQGVVRLEWEEEPFEWVRPHRFGVVRNYRRGPVRQLRTLTELLPRSDGGTTARYHVWARPASLIGIPAIYAQIGVISAHNFRRIFFAYDRLAQQQKLPTDSPTPPRFPPGGRDRLENIRAELIRMGSPSDLVGRLVAFIRDADDISLVRLRPYMLADYWGVSRRQVLEICLRAVRAGLLDFRWDLLCPQCRGAKQTGDTLADIHGRVHCDACNIDFTVNFDQSVELTFRPNPSIRTLEIGEYCVGGPQVTPHIIAQQLLAAGETKTLAPQFEAGRYRLRMLGHPGALHLRITREGTDSAAVGVDGAWQADEIDIQPGALLTLSNPGTREQLVILERTAWSDQIVTAAEVTGLQLFRDLFASEALRPSEQISVGSLTVLFTDLRESTRLYRDIGDAPAFGIVMSHFDILREAIGAEDGAIVKTIGDSVMAVFRRPVNALRAALKAQETLRMQTRGGKPLLLKVGIHSGTAIAVTLNDRLDYFGTTINIAARLEGLSSGTDIVISPTIYTDPEVASLIDYRDVSLHVEPFEARLKGFDQEAFQLWRVELSRLAVSSLRLDSRGVGYGA